MRHHSSPPQSAAEEKEYDGLMAKYVGHPDVSMQMQGAKISVPGHEDQATKMLDLDASFLQ